MLNTSEMRRHRETFIELKKEKREADRLRKRTIRNGDKVVVLRDIYRFDGPKTVESVCPMYGTLRYGSECILYAAKGETGVVIETFKSGVEINPMRRGRWNAKVLIANQWIKTFRVTSLGLLEE